MRIRRNFIRWKKNIYFLSGMFLLKRSYLVEDKICVLISTYPPPQTKNKQGPQKLSSLKSLKIKTPPPIPGIFTPATIINGFHIKFYVAYRSTNSGKKLNVTLWVREWHLSNWASKKSFMLVIATLGTFEFEKDK